MKKITSLFLGILISIPLLCSCSTQNRSETTAPPNTPSATDSPGMETPKVASSKEKLRLIQPYYGSGNKNGFYYLPEEASEDGYINIRYIDYASKQDIVLCNKPNCKHDNETCTSYVNCEDAPDIQLIADEANLYIISSSTKGISFSATQDTSVDSSSIDSSLTIYRANLDGSNRIEIANLEDGSQLQSNDYILGDNKLYFVIYKTKQVTIDSSIHSVTQKKELVEVDLLHNTVKTIFDFMNCDIVGVWDGRILVKKMHFKKNPDEMSDNEFRNALNKLKVSFFSLDIKSNQTITHLETDYKNAEDICYEDGKLYFSKNKDKILKCLELQTNKTKIVTKKLPGGYMDKIIDGKLLYNCDDGKYLNAEFTDSYGIDLKSGAISKRNLFIAKPRMPVEILADTGNYYLVRSDCTYKEEKTWAGTMQVSITSYINSFISKKDYWKSNANYIGIKEKK